MNKVKIVKMNRFFCIRSATNPCKYTSPIEMLFMNQRCTDSLYKKKIISHLNIRDIHFIYFYRIFSLGTDQRAVRINLFVFYILD